MTRIRFGQGLHSAGILLRLSALALLVFFMSPAFFVQAERLFLRHIWWLPIFLVVWAVSLLALIVAALQPNWPVRVFWAAVTGISAAAGYSFFLISGADLTVYDALSLWNARHEAGRALDFYSSTGVWAVLVLAASFLLIVAPPVPRAPKVRRCLTYFAWAPALPLALMGGILLVRDGTGLRAMPYHLQPLAVGSVAALRVAIDPKVERFQVGWTSTPDRSIRNVVLLVDESIRADYLNWRKGNDHTPVLAANRARFAIFGQAASGANCSALSNGILRFGGTRTDFVGSVRTNPTIWRYAKEAGFRTVYIDGQSGFLKNDRKLQNFMTLEELEDIDRHVTYDQVPPPELDLRVLQVLAEELAGPQPVFIYANKNGAHFPYDSSYPQDQAIFRPTMSTAANLTPDVQINSYRNAVRWSVDHFFERLLKEVDLSTTAILYTSDHGQRLDHGRMSHCTKENPDPRQALVPLLALTGDERLMQRFRAAAELNWHSASHFAITPTLLELMGYSTADIAARYGPSLFVRQETPPAFTSEYIFGLFRPEVSWTPIDLNANYLEDFTDSQAASEPAFTDAVELDTIR